MTIGDFKNLAEVFALLMAGLYFLYKFVTGYFISNLSISVMCTRQPAPSVGEDYLFVTATLSKGDRGSINLHDAKARVKWQRGEQIEPLIGVDRLSFKKEPVKGVDCKILNWQKRSKKAPLLRLTPGEQSQFSCYLRVPTDEVCTVEIGVIGKKPKSWRVGQWRASIISLPMEKRVEVIP